MLTIAFEHPEAQPISGSFSFLIHDGWYCYYSNLDLVDFHLEHDRDAMLLRLAKFVEAGVERRLLRKLFKVSRSTLQRAVNRFRNSGDNAFFDISRKSRGVSSIIGKTKKKAERLLAGGKSAYAVAKIPKFPSRRSTTIFGRASSVPISRSGRRPRNSRARRTTAWSGAELATGSTARRRWAGVRATRRGASRRQWANWRRRSRASTKPVPPSRSAARSWRSRCSSRKGS